MDPDDVKKALLEACADMDAGRAMRRPVFALSTAMIASMGMSLWSGCREVAMYAAVHSGDYEDCANAVDDDLDGLVDCEDTDCRGAAECPDTEADCTNALDDDADGLVDCDDVDDCSGDPACATDAYRAP